MEKCEININKKKKCKININEEEKCKNININLIVGKIQIKCILTSCQKTLFILNLITIVESCNFINYINFIHLPTCRNRDTSVFEFV